LFDSRQVAAGHWDWFRVRASQFREAYLRARSGTESALASASTIARG
jgi:hypothetical protein